MSSDSGNNTWSFDGFLSMLLAGEVKRGGA